MSEPVKISSHLCLTKDLGQSGNLFGGNMMAWIDEAAAIFAIQSTGEDKVVSLRFAEMMFRHPVKVGDILEFFCGNVRRGRTSVTFDVWVTCRGTQVFHSECTFVAIEEDGSKKVIDWDRVSPKW